MTTSTLPSNKDLKLLRTSELRYRRLFETAKDGILLVDFKTGIILDVNPFLTDLLGFTKRDLLRKHLWEVGVFKDIAASKTNFITLQKKGYVRFEDLPLETKSGKTIDVEFVANSYHSNGDIIIQCNVRDISERVRLTKEIKILSSIVSQSTEGIGTCDLNGKINYVNQAWAKIHGYDSPQELLGKNISVFHTKEQVINEVIPFNQKTLKLGTNNGEVGHVRRNGKVFPGYMNATVLKDAKGKVCGMVGSVIDITEKKMAETALTDSELRYRRLFEAAQDGIIILDADNGKITDANPYIKKTLDYSQEELIGKELWEIGIFKDIADSKQAFKQLQTKKYIRYNDLPLETKSGRKINVEFVSNVYSVGSNKVIQCNIRDITDRKVAENTISLLSVAIKSAANAIIITDPGGKMEWVNPAFTKLTGYSFKEAVGQSTRVLNSGRQTKTFYKQLWETILAGKIWKGEIVNRKKNGSLYTEEQTISPVKNKMGEVINFIAIKQDISAQKETADKLRLRNKELEKLNKNQVNTQISMLNILEDLESAKKLIETEKVKDDAMLDSIGEGLIAVDNSHRIVTVNKAAVRMLGWQPKELIGLDICDLQLVDENKKPIPNKKRPTMIALVKGKSVDANYFFVRKNKTVFPIAINVTPIKLRKKIIGAIDIFRDITKETEINRAKSEFVSLASHQLRTPLGISKWYLEAIVKEKFFDQAPQSSKNYLNEVYVSIERLIDLVNDLLSVSRIDQGKVRNAPMSVDVSQIIATVCQGVGILAKKDSITINIIAKSKIPSLTIDPRRFQEVLENLLTNAIVYSNPKGTVSIMTKVDNGYIVIAIQDHGVGISENDQHHLFSRFFRAANAVTKNAEGSGLGLYVVKSYVDAWGGKITVDSTENIGTTVTIYLPLERR